jgi:ABC-type multidrug transport system fused ATPase/permease subunit
VGPKGSHVSGGQKQRIAIARAILRHPSVLLLDEATSALDPENEAKVEQSLERLMKNKTTLNITHRLEKLEGKHQIYVLKKGQVVEKGSYEQLVKTEGVFYNMQHFKSH